MGKWESGIYRERHDTWGNGSLVYIERGMTHGEMGVWYIYRERGMTHGEMGVWYIYRERHDTWGNGSLVYI